MTEERILVIQLRQLGDILLTTACVQAIRQERPKARITFLSHKMGCLVLDGNPHLDEHFFYDETWTTAMEWRLARTLRERRFDLVIDFMNNPRSAFYTLMSGGQTRVGFRSARRLAYNVVVSKPEQPGYIVDHKFLLLEAAGFSPQDRGLVLPWSEAHTKPLMKLLGEDDRYKSASLRVVLSPTHRRAVRRWPLARYAELADYLTREWQAHVMWIWGPGEEAVIDEVRDLCTEPTTKAPSTSFRELAALIGNADLFIGNSNGPSHIAVAAAIPSLQLHGHTDARSWCPMTSRHRAVQTPGFGLVKMPLMESLSFERVLDELTMMRPVIEAYASEVRRHWPRLSWRHT